MIVHYAVLVVAGNGKPGVYVDAVISAIDSIIHVLERDYISLL